MTKTLLVIKQEIKKRKRLHKMLLGCYCASLYFIKERHWLYFLFLKVQVFFDRRKKLHRYAVMGVREYCKKNGIDIKILEKSQERKIYAPAYFKSRHEKIHTRTSPDIYMVELPEVDVVGSNSFLIKGRYCLYDMFCFDGKDRYDLRCSSLKSLCKKEAIVTSVSAGQESLVEVAIFLLGFTTFNYFHLTVETLIKLAYINTLPIAKEIPLLIDEVTMATPQFNSLLSCLNIHNRKLIVAKNGHAYHIKRLLYFSECMWMPINLNDGYNLIPDDFRVAQGGLEYVRKTVLANLSLKKNNTSERRIFISRRSKYYQRLINEKQVADFFCEHGFEVIYPEELSFKEQVKIFSEASYVAGTTGAALTNIIYCSPGATLICITPMEYDFHMYSTLARMTNLNSIFIDAKILQKGIKISRDQFMLDMHLCKSLLNELDLTNVPDSSLSVKKNKDD